ncbi:MAG: glycosyl hydrolase, partial [Acidobacteriota bacterium]
MRRNANLAFCFACLLLLAGLTIDLPAQGGGNDPNITVNPSLYEGLRYRLLDFGRGGRSTAVAGVSSDPLTYYAGYTGGGVWKTQDAGQTWTSVSDDHFEAGSIGAITVADSDPNVIYVGTGSACPRGNISPGIGVYKSTDAGKTWRHIGLRESGQIGRIQVHPKDHDLVYVAALGHIFGSNAERGVFRSKDGGRTWEKVLFVSNKTGAVDISLDANNPRVIYAAMWTVVRKPWTIDSGSEESGLYQSTDGGDTWSKLGGGLPSGVVGRIAVSASPARPDRVWALVEAPEDRGGIFRTEDGGKTWRKINGERRFLQRAWYYIHIYADPKSPETVYVLNTGFYKSSDGGRTFQSYRVPHGDNHDLWINPHDPQKMINANDGGANVSFNGAQSWTGQMNQPTAEFYRITADNRFPYRVYGAQQDNSTASVSSRGSGDFYDVGGGESGHIAVDPRNPDIVYAGSYGGTITRTDVGTGLSRSIMAYPESATGQRAADMKYRFQWNAPIRISPHDPDVVYHCSQFVHRSRDAGLSWEIISPDLTRNDKSKQDYSGNPITHDNTGVEVFGTVFALEESPRVAGLLWAGSDDGPMHLSRDNGKTWKNVSPTNIPPFGTVNMIDLSAHDPGRAFIAVHKYREDDFKPYVFRTNNYGESWDLLTDGRNGIPANHFVRVVREDPDRKGLLYAGTEFGMYISFDDGAHWQKFQLNLPVTPITDLMVYRKDLLVATQGRSFWILDDLSPLHQINKDTAAAKVHLFAPRAAYRAPGYSAEINAYF